MVESTEGLGNRKWSLLEEIGDGGLERFVMQGKFVIARIDYLGELPAESAVPRFDRASVRKIQALLVTAPQLWDAANELIKAAEEIARKTGSPLLVGHNYERLCNMVAKAVDKIAWKDVLQY